MNTLWKDAAESSLGASIVSLSALGGGDFARAFQATLSNRQSVFIKTHDKPPAYFFTTEATGLEWLRSAGAVNVPQVLAVDDKPPYLAMQWIELGHANEKTEVELGRELAQLHRIEFNSFGRPDARTTGSLAVPNDPCDSWSEFYASRRLLPLAQMAQDRNALSRKCVSGLEKLASKLDEFCIANEPPSLLHGDLWAGNRVVDVQGKSWLIDPAAHGGHREFDLAMMQLFGGYDQACFAAYREAFPLQEEWQSRIALHQLAPLIVHAIKFGGSYSAATERALSNYL